MKRILLIGLAVGCVHFLFVTMLEHISRDSQIATLYFGLFGANGGELFQDLLIPVFAVVAHYIRDSLFSWKPVDYTYCLVASSAVYGLFAAGLSMIFARVRVGSAPVESGTSQ